MFDVNVWLVINPIIWLDSNDIKPKKNFILFYFSMAGLAEVLAFISKNPKLTDMEIIKKGKKKIFLF